MKKITLTEADVIAFWQRVRRVGQAHCWQWTGTLNTRGEGVIRIHGKEVAAKKVAWLLSGRPMPKAGYVFERVTGPECNNRGCVNPDHVRVVPLRTSRSRAGRKAQKRMDGTAPDSLGDWTLEEAMLHVKHDALAAHEALSQTREGVLLQELVSQGERFQKRLDAITERLDELAAAQGRGLSALAERVGTAADKLEQKMGEVAARPTPPMLPAAAPEHGAGESTESPPAELGDLLVQVYAPVAGVSTEDVGPASRERLLQLLDRALAAHDGHGGAAMQTFRSWLAELRSAPSRERGIAALEAIVDRHFGLAPKGS